MMLQSRSARYTFLIPVLLCLSLLLDGFLSTFFAAEFYSESYTLVPRLLVFVFVFLIFYFPKERFMLYAFLIGLFYDSFYTGILGVYTAVLCMMVYILKKIQQTTPPNVLVVLSAFVVAVTFTDTIIYGFYVLMDITTMPFSQFLTHRLGPTLLLNAVLYVFLYFPMFRLASWMYD